MKRSIIFIIATIITSGLFAQSNTTVITTIQGDGYTYIKETKHNFLVELYNQENEYVDVPLVYKETGEKPDFNLREERVEDDDWTYLRFELIIRSAFTEEQRQAVSGHKLGVGIYVDSTTGKVIETEYTFHKMGPFSDIPISVFREIELNMKDEIYFTVSEAGKKVNYIYFYRILEVI